MGFASVGSCAVVSAVHTDRSLRVGTSFFLPSAFDIGGICVRVHAVHAASARGSPQRSAAQRTLQHLTAGMATRRLFPELIIYYLLPCSPLRRSLRLRPSRHRTAGRAFEAAPRVRSDAHHPSSAHSRFARAV